MSDELMPEGKFKGVTIQQVPPGYLRRLANTRGPLAQIAREEMRRRGMTVYALEVTAHAVDRASLRAPRLFLDTRLKDEGLHAWLGRMAEAALLKANPNGRINFRVEHEGIVWVFDLRYEVPVLMSIWLPHETEEHENSEAIQGPHGLSGTAPQGVPGGHGDGFDQAGAREPAEEPDPQGLL